MSFAYTCDWCGLPIEDDTVRVTLLLQHRLEGGEPLDRVEAKNRDGWFGHYHDDCWAAVSDQLRLVHEMGQAIANIPTISGQAVAARRRKHTKPSAD